MANFFKATNKKQTLGQQININIERLDHNGCGVGQYQNKPVFVEGTLLHESVLAKIFEKKGKYSRAKLIEVTDQSEHRVDAECAHFKVCGGCDLQHLNFDQHLTFKQEKVAQLYTRHNINAQLPWQPSIESSPWHYRRKARIGVQYNKAGQATIGFRQRATNQLTAIKHCPVLVAPLKDIFSQLKAVIQQLTIHSAIGHVEVVVTEQTTLIVRQLKAMNKADKQRWHDAAKKYNWQVVIDNGDNVTPLFEITELQYYLPNHIEIKFEPKDFIQVNHDVNVKMIEQAMQWLALKPTDKVLDLFCGLGNFTLPLAQQVHSVVGVEGLQVMVDKAKDNALTNKINNCSFYQADLNADWSSALWNKAGFDKVLLDPARAGAYQALEQLLKLSIPSILYISCDPSSLARDSELILAQGYKMEKISIMEMFPQTKHIETMVLFSR
ncbi:MAG: 23S rRNA (uracil(1939)-C(5))-methyltransferase RlmD [Colwellia sp.]|nr:23S rRNA (uracil(1939)-C(5))-methyltransferase RlmD [Colwellia sp.]